MKLFAAILLFAGLCSAQVPADNSTSSATLVKRTVGGVYFCTDANWQGTCGYKVQPLNTCIQITAPWDTTLSSLGPDPCTGVDLWPREAGGCNSNVRTGWNFGWPGSNDLGRDSPYNDDAGYMKVYYDQLYCN